MRYDLTDFEWSVIEPVLPKGNPGPRRKDDRRVMNGIFWILRAGAPWRDLPNRYGPYTTVYNRFNRWRKAGVWDRLMDAVTKAHDGKLQMIDSSIVRVHQHAAGGDRHGLGSCLSQLCERAVSPPSRTRATTVDRRRASHQRHGSECHCCNRSRAGAHMANNGPNLVAVPSAERRRGKLSPGPRYLDVRNKTVAYLKF